MNQNEDNYLKNTFSIEKAPLSDYNYKIYNRSSSKIDIEKAHYEAELLLDQEEKFFYYEKSIYVPKN